MIIIDATNICHIAKHSTGKLKYGNVFTGVVFGFFQAIKRITKELQDNFLIFAWDADHYKRKDLYPEYKADRAQRKLEKTDEELKFDEVSYRQFKLIRKRVLFDFGFRNNFIFDGYEADDIIASIVLALPPGTQTPIVVSTDEDDYQLLDKCRIYNPITKQTITRLSFIKEYGIEPRAWASVKALSGYKDNISGIKGVGKITAIKYITGLLNQGKLYEKIKEQEKEVLERNMPLCKLPFDHIELLLQIHEDFKLQDFIDICDQYGFHSYLKMEEMSFWKNMFLMR